MSRSSFSTSSSRCSTLFSWAGRAAWRQTRTKGNGNAPRTIIRCYSLVGTSVDRAGLPRRARLVPSEGLEAAAVRRRADGAEERGDPRIRLVLRPVGEVVVLVLH